MMSHIRSFILVFLFWTLVGILSKGLFLLIYHSLFADASLSELLQVFWYGLRLDLAIAGYLTAIPGLLLVVVLWCKQRLVQWIWNGYFILAALISSLAYIANLGLYGYWGFPLDNTPLLYVKTSPADAMASLVWWQLIIVPIVILLLACCKGTKKSEMRKQKLEKKFVQKRVKPSLINLINCISIK